MAKFKVGDIVRIVKEFDGFDETCTPTVGKIGVVKGLFENGYIKVFLDDSNDLLFYEEECLKLVDNDTSPEYTYDDVIIDPNDPRVEIGAEYYFALGAQACIDYANRDVKKRTLDDIDTSGNYSPFITDEKDYPFIIRKKEPSYEERQAEWIKENDIKVGDKVRIIKESPPEEGFVDEMKPLVGTIGEIKKINDDDIQVYTEDKVDWWRWPYYCLEKVEEPEKKYVPFDLNNEEDRAKLRGAWVRIKGSRRLEQQIVALAINTQLVFLPDVVSVETKELLEGYEFLDGTPCGKLVEDEQ